MQHACWSLFFTCSIHSIHSNLGHYMALALAFDGSSIAIKIQQVLQAVHCGSELERKSLQSFEAFRTIQRLYYVFDKYDKCI